MSIVPSLSRGILIVWDEIFSLETDCCSIKMAKLVIFENLSGNCQGVIEGILSIILLATSSTVDQA